MIDYTEISIQEFDRNIDQIFTLGDKDDLEIAKIIKNMGRISFSRFARSDSLYFSLSHTLTAAKIGLEILNSIKCRSGVVRQGFAVNFMAAVLFCNVGIIKGILKEDSLDHFKVSEAKSVKISEDKTDSILWKYKCFRSCRFIESIPFLNVNINMELVSSAVETSDIMNNSDISSDKIGEIDKYNRATQIVALMAEGNHKRTLTEYYYSAQEAGVMDSQIFPNLGEFKDKWAQYFWDSLYSHVAETILMLRETDQGRNIVSSIYTHL